MPSDLVHNERTKLPANALDRTPTAAPAVGVLGLIVTPSDGLGPSDRPFPSLGLILLGLIVGTILWMLVAIALHVFALWTVRDLR